MTENVVLWNSCKKQTSKCSRLEIILNWCNQLLVTTFLAAFNSTTENKDYIHPCVGAFILYLLLEAVAFFSALIARYDFGPREGTTWRHAKIQMHCNRYLRISWTFFIDFIPLAWVSKPFFLSSRSPPTVNVHSTSGGNVPPGSNRNRKHS